ncbi:ABC transporter substrate-binding protein [Sphaerochaeta sp.]|jgi:arabinosaccharide transport system substrate-binding protein|uniref:ABC transporter substrate-binding protein n=1 Tax=Sphaerochaeta sp. TaxID=1972642 RepID=UPI00258B9E59|nr:ABC transporter substrate-binding protein [Sphaerochaeta sp.]MDD3423921.1 ABC transporter substrate-binding protein [Sphaerochaeta sp.]
MKKGLSVLLVLMVGASLLMAGGAKETSITPKKGETVTIKMWTHDDLYRQFFQKRIDMMNENNPDYQIALDAQIMPNTITSLITASVAGEALPDLIGVEQGWFPTLMEDGNVDTFLVDLTDKIGDRYDDYVQGRWALYNYEGKIYGLESALTASVLYYQPAIFEKYGVAIPTTWEAYIEAGKKLAAHGVKIGVMDNDSSGIFSMMFLQRGGQFFDQSGKLVLGEGKNREAAIKVLDMLRDALDANALQVVLGNDFWGSTIPTAFSTGKVAGMVAPDWYNTSVLQPGVASMAGSWRVAPMPVWQDGSGYRTSVWGGTGFAITQSSKIKDIVWDVLDDAYMSLDGQLDRYKTIGFYPTMYEALDSPAVTEEEHSFFGGQKIGAVFADVALETPPLWQSPARPFLLQAMVDNLPLFIEGKLTSSEFVDTVVKVTERDAQL